jgi:3-oxoacyl-[acyl-carrier-protein] synthase II
MSEGAAVLILERLDQAIARKAEILALVLGGSSTTDAYHITAPEPNGAGALSCMTAALRDSGLRVDDIAAVNAHGTGTPLNDAAEVAALRKLFGRNVPPVVSNKGATGHPIGASGAMEAVASILSIRSGEMPPTVGCDEIDPDFSDAGIVRDASTWNPGPVISNSFGFGGHNASVVLAPYEN